MLFRLKSDDGELLSNSFIYDSSNGEIYYRSISEVDGIADRLKTVDCNISLKTGILAKMAVFREHFILFQSSMVKASVFYYEDVSSWVFHYESLVESLEFNVGKSFDYRNTFLVDFGGYLDCTSVIPAVYAEYLILNDNARRREVSNIFRHVNCKVYNEYGVMYTNLNSLGA